MFQALTPQPADKILEIAKAFKADPRPDKIDLGVGVYKDANGLTPIMRAIKAAEQQVWQSQNSKSYTALTGEGAFLDAMVDLVLGRSVPRDSVAAAAAPGGTGAVRQGFELARLAKPDVRVFVSDPTWPNHVSMLKFMGLETVPYRYFDAETRGVAFDAMLADLAGAHAGDVVLLHGCCHNPTGANLTDAQWSEVIALLERTGALPMVDIAYQGFGDGLEADASATCRLAESLPECIIAASCSKNFGIYRERTGILMVTGGDTAVMQGTLAFLNRQNFSFPPDHGARLVSTILTDDALRADWQSELDEMRRSMEALRGALAAELQQRAGSDRFAFLAQHRGMFSRLGASPEQVARLRDEHAVYLVGDSRLNIAGLNARSIPRLAEAILAVGI